MRRLAVTLAVGCLVSVAAGRAVAAGPPPPPPKFWAVSRCEQVLRTRDYAFPTAEGYRFHAGQVTCVGAGGADFCRWTNQHSRLFSQFVVFSRSRYIGGVVRSFTLATRAGSGLVRMGHFAGDQYVGWPADFFVSPSSVRLLAASATAAGFNGIVAPLAARVSQQENARGCTSG
jgi:hypothetical protein